MRLSHINLAGFKSFVDPTHIALPGQIVGIVGPNGCGKSNVIDALRWVLGESKASALRGESMQDVIFNGSGNRKPVARASVELVFDNSLGKAIGQWSSYAEIAIKRVLKRDGESSYYINNQHVRRKDVTDIFLGTGLGARAYAIIEQGMISRIIEAKPEELRVFLEEAAGVSKYRDRRRETELRIGDTRENLLRVADILHELDKQLQHLTEQAEVAKRYRELQLRHDTTQRLLWLLNKQEATTRRLRFAQAVEKTKNELESETARVREVESQLESARSEHYGLADTLHSKQGELYAVNAEVSRLEQQLSFLSEQRNRLAQQIANAERQIEVQRTQLQGTQGLLVHWQEEQQEAGLRVAERESHAEIEAQQLPQAEELARAVQARYNEVQREHLQLQQQLQLAETQRVHIQRNLQQLEARISRLQQEQAFVRPRNLAIDEGLVGGIVHQEKVLAQLDFHLRTADEIPDFLLLLGGIGDGLVHPRLELLDHIGSRMIGIRFQRLLDRLVEGTEQSVAQRPLGRTIALVGIRAGLAKLPVELLLQRGNLDDRGVVEIEMERSQLRVVKCAGSAGIRLHAPLQDQFPVRAGQAIFNDVAAR